MAEENHKIKSKTSKLIDFITHPKWGPFKHFLSVIGVLIAIILWFVFDVPEFLNPNSRIDSDKQQSEISEPKTSKVVVNTKPKQDLSLSDNELRTARESSKNSTDKTLKLLEDMIRENEQYDYLNGKNPRSNFEIFLKKYYGLSGNPKLGDELLKSMIGKEIEWSVQVRFIQPSENGAWILVGVNNPVCEGNECPDNFLDDVFIEFDDIEGLPSILKKDDFIHVRGILVDFADKTKIPLLRNRAHIHWKKILYNEAKD